MSTSEVSSSCRCLRCHGPNGFVVLPHLPYGARNSCSQLEGQHIDSPCFAGYVVGALLMLRCSCHRGIATDPLFRASLTNFTVFYTELFSGKLEKSKQGQPLSRTYRTKVHFYSACWSTCDFLSFQLLVSGPGARAVYTLKVYAEALIKRGSPPPPPF